MVGTRLTAIFFALAASSCLTNRAKGPRLPRASTQEEAPSPSRGRMLVIRLEQTVGSDTAKAGDPVKAQVGTPLVGKGGQILVPQGAPVEGHVRKAENGQGSKTPKLELVFDRVLVDGKWVKIRGEVEAADPEIASPGSKEDPLAKANAGAAMGAAMAGYPGLLMGFEVGTAAGMTGAVRSRVAALRFSSGSFLTLRLL